MEQEIKNCQNCKQNFVVEPEDFVFYDKIKVPSPTWCPECRMIRRFGWRNEKTLYKRPDSNTGEPIFSMLSASAPLKVYNHAFWWSDRWDSMKYGREIDW